VRKSFKAGFSYFFSVGFLFSKQLMGKEVFHESSMVTFDVKKLYHNVATYKPNMVERASKQVKTY